MSVCIIIFKQKLHATKEWSSGHCAAIRYRCGWQVAGDEASSPASPDTPAGPAVPRMPPATVQWLLDNYETAEGDVSCNYTHITILIYAAFPSFFIVHVKFFYVNNETPDQQTPCLLMWTRELFAC